MSQPGAMRSERRLSFARKVLLVLSFLLLALGLGNLVQLSRAVYFAIHLPELPMTVSWAYLATMGGFWGAIFIACTVGLVRFRSWGRWSTLVAITLYEAHTWLNHLLFDASDYAHVVWPRDLVLTALLLVIVWGTLNWPGVRKMFER